MYALGLNMNDEISLPLQIILYLVDTAMKNDIADAEVHFIFFYKDLYQVNFSGIQLVYRYLRVNLVLS